jgi:hypothetical protein
MLALGYAFVCVSYYAGIMLLSLPIPHRGVKQAGRALVEEGGISAVLLASVPMIPTLANLVSSMLYGEGAIDRAYEDLYVWLSGTASYCVLANTIIAESLALMARLDSMISWWMPGVAIFGNISTQIADVIEPWTAAVAGTHVFCEMLKRVALIIQANWLSLLYIGVLLFTVPKGVTRGAAATIISTVVTYYVMLPLLPAFVAVIAPGLLEQLTPITINPAEYGILGGRVSGGQAEQLASATLLLTLGWANHLTFLIWSRTFLPAFFLTTIVALIAAGVGRILGGRVPWLLTSIAG